MPNALTTPLHALIKQAASGPRTTGESARYAARHNRVGKHVILCDTSTSMAQQEGLRTRHDHLRDALSQVAGAGDALIAFSSSAKEFATPADLPPPEGGTALELGLAAAARHDPAATLVISDGEPNVPDQALDAASRLPGVINVLFCGDEANRAAVEFMRQLARLGAGRMHVHRWADQTRTPIASAMRLLLEGPRR